MFDFLKSKRLVGVKMVTLTYNEKIVGVGTYNTRPVEAAIMLYTRGDTRSYKVVIDGASECMARTIEYYQDINVELWVASGDRNHVTGAIWYE